MCTILKVIIRHFYEGKKKAVEASLYIKASATHHRVSTRMMLNQCNSSIAALTSGPAKPVHLLDANSALITPSFLSNAEPNARDARTENHFSINHVFPFLSFPPRCSPRSSR